ncbi:MAG: hypothetical protein FJ225_06380 [Lentisphaerae bacterium]|nr:hypothetical protein [Lentisphaerota bacterium]
MTRPLRLVAALLLCAGLLGVSGCVFSSPLSPQPGLLVSVTSYPHPQCVSSPELGKRTGSSSAVNILGLIAVGDASVEEAARSAGIARIATIDHSYLNVFWLFSVFKTIVTGD